MFFVLGSVITVTSVYYTVLPQAGLVLAPSVLWLTIASKLVFDIWTLNEPATQPLYPHK